MGWPAASPAEIEQVGDVHRQLEGRRPSRRAPISLRPHARASSSESSSSSSSSCGARRGPRRGTSAGRSRVFSRQVQSGPQTISSAGGGAAAGDLEGHLAGGSMPPARPLARSADQRRRSPRRPGRPARAALRPSRRAAPRRALSETASPSEVCRLRIASLWAARLSSSGITSLGVGRRLAVEPHVADAVLVVERPERRQKLRRHCDWPAATSPYPLPLLHGSAPCALESTIPVTASSAKPVRAKVQKGTYRLQLK